MTFFAPVDSKPFTATRSISVHAENSAVCEPLNQSNVGGVAQNTLTNDQREAAIALAGRAIERHMTTYKQTNCFDALGMADRARMSMETLIKGRSAAQVARMEADRGLV